jgi:hypothetical protein
MNQRKLLTKLLQESNNELELIDFLDRMVARKLTDNRVNPPEPIGKNNYVGIEVECFSDLEEIEVMQLLLEFDLEKYVNIGDDGSIEADYGNSYELRILSTEKELSVVLKNLGLLFKAGKFGVNDSCGLHVHLDMRNRNVNKCYKKLLKFQHLMFPLVNKDRWNNEYCSWSLESEKYGRDAVNFGAYDDHQTIEIRLHHGTLDVKRIGNWISLLLRAIKNSPIKEINSKSQAVKWAGNNKKLKSYIKKEFDTSWFKEKQLVIPGYDDSEEIIF